MQDQPKLKDVGQVLDRLDRNWQVLVQLFQEGQGKLATQSARFCQARFPRCCR